MTQTGFHLNKASSQSSHLDTLNPVFKVIHQLVNFNDSVRKWPCLLVIDSLSEIFMYILTHLTGL